MAHEHDDEHDHDHGKLAFRGTQTEGAVVSSLDALHPTLARNLALSRRYAELSEDEKAQVLASQREVELHRAWSPGYHSGGDVCGACGKPTTPLFKDALDVGELSYAAFVDDVPVHATRACLDAFAAKHPKRSPQLLDRLRREHAKDRLRPSAHMTQFFRHDLLKHGSFALEDWANSVAQANAGKLDKATMRDVERLITWVHGKLFH